MCLVAHLSEAQLRAGAELEYEGVVDLLEAPEVDVEAVDVHVQQQQEHGAAREEAGQRGGQNFRTLCLEKNRQSNRVKPTNGLV